MSYRSQRVWTIDAPKLVSWAEPSEPETATSIRAAPVGPSIHMPAPRGHSALAAYLLGPVAARIWGASYPGGTFADLTAVVFGIALLASWSPFTKWLGHVPYGPSIWLVIVPTLTLAVASAWARSIATARPPSSRPGSWVARWGRDPRVVGVLGLFVPGLGLMIAKCRRHAAASFWLVGPLAASGVVLLNRGWLWEKSHSLVSPGVHGDTLEVVFAAAAGVCMLTMLGWIVQALDGARRVSDARGHSDLAAMALVFTVMLFGATYHPASIGRQLHAAASGLRSEGFRVIPYALCETAARLDPATPTYWVDAADLAESLGMRQTAREHRQLVERRVIEWRVAAGVERTASAPVAAATSAEVSQSTGAIEVW